MLSSFAIPVCRFGLTTAPLGNYVFTEFTLILVYGNMLLLRFPQAILFTIGAFALSIAVVLT